MPVSRLTLICQYDRASPQYSVSSPLTILLGSPHLTSDSSGLLVATDLVQTQDQQRSSPCLNLDPDIETVKDSVQAKKGGTSHLSSSSVSIFHHHFQSIPTVSAIKSHYSDLANFLAPASLAHPFPRINRVGLQAGAEGDQREDDHDDDGNGGGGSDVTLDATSVLSRWSAAGT